MKPFPRELIAAYPGDPLSSRIPDRPWWRFNPAGFGGDYVRFGAHGDTWTAESPGHAARLDVEHPMPFPGVRVGQVWAHHELPAKPLGVFAVSDFRLGMYRVGSAWLNEGEAASLCSRAFLLADPACPHLAPWAPAANP